MSIKFTETADRDFTSIGIRIAEEDPVAAGRTVTRISYLENLPRRGRPGLLLDTRELSIADLPYKTVYRIEGDVILIITIIHTSACSRSTGSVIIEIV